MSLEISSNLPFTEEEFAAEMARLRELASQVTSEDEARRVTSRIAQIARRYRIITGVSLPGSPMEQALEIDHLYVQRPHLQLLSDRITNAVRDVEKGTSRKISTSMPPRAGKSRMTSFYSPLWILRRHPEWKIAMVSYTAGLVRSWAKEMRDLIETRPDLGISLKSDGGAGGKWTTTEGGGMFTTEVGGDFTGYGAKVLIFDDPIKDYVAAHSPRVREGLWKWWLTVASTRMESPYLQLVTMCMTGDTPVLMADGTEKPLRDIRPGDAIATYEEGRISVSTVRNWADQGPDKVYEIRMTSGTTVRANARHPFLTVESGAEKWRRTDQLRQGSRILRATGESIAELPAQLKDARNLHAAGTCVTPTTARLAGPLGTGHLQSVPSPAELYAYAGGMASNPKTTTGCLPSKTGDAESAYASPVKLLDQSTGLKFSPLIIAMTPEPCEDCSATTVISSSGGLDLSKCSEGLSSTLSVTLDEVLEVVPAGTEHVFDLQVDRTENFIANGLVSHNTRWHDDDFIGRLYSDEFEGDPREWERIVLPALADRGGDVLGRSEGQPLYPPLMDLSESDAIAHWQGMAEAVGSYGFASMYQQRPAPAEGAVFKAGTWRYWTRFPENATEDGRVVHLDPGTLSDGKWIDSWDFSFKGTASSDWVVGQRWVRHKANRYLIHQVRKRLSFTETLKQFVVWAGDDPIHSPCGRFVHIRLVEDKANGPAIIDSLKDEVSGIRPVNPRDSKEARARAVTPEVESGNVLLPYPHDAGNEWVLDLESELRNFPHDSYDDQVDAFTQALLDLRTSGFGMLTVPGKSSNVQQLYQPMRRTNRTGQGPLRQAPWR